MAGKITLSDVPVDDLIGELQRRPGIVASVWNTEDVIETIREDEDCAGFGEDQLQAAAELFLSKASRGLQEILGQRGNDYTSEKWSDIKAEVIAEVRGAAPTA